MTTIHLPEDYWTTYFADRFQFGLGTEDILAGLRELPPTPSWLDLGAGSESLLWSIGLRPSALTAADVDPDRLDRLRAYAANGRPRGAYETALRLCGRSDDDWAVRCAALIDTRVADCLTGGPLPFDPGTFDLVTQFGLFGLCRDPDHFLACWNAATDLISPGGWFAGANWVTTDANDRSERVELTEQLYRDASDAAGITLTLLRRRRVLGDPDFSHVWLYTGRTP
jgi:hypothetical protein